MSDREPLHIFHIAREDGTSLFLHPFLDRQRVMERMESHTLEGLYGREPRVEAITQFRNELYRLIEDEVRDWIGESRFIPRFLISAGVFLLVYVGLSVAVRDPLPVVDEIAIALGAAIAAFLLRRRRDMRSDEALSRRMKLRSKVDGIVFSESEFVKQLEDLLHSEEGSSTEAIVERLSANGEAELDPSYQGEASEFLSYLKAKFGSSEYRKQEKRLLGKDRGGMNSRDREHIARWAASRKVDLPLFALYLRLKRRLAKRPTG
jgi:hypothetical protein